MFILDTNVVSELRKTKTGTADPHVIAWASAVSPYSLYVSIISILELEIGVLRIERKDTVQGGALREWLDKQVLIAFAERIVPVDLQVAQRCADLHVPDPRSERDAVIAATALVHGMSIVTRNVADFEATRVPIVNPWDVSN
jgi:predicted nucleic acid-binding protein